MNVPGIFRDDKNGNFSHTKFWAAVAYTAMTVAFLRAAFPGPISDTLMFAYGAVVAGSHVATKFVSMKYGGQS